MARHVDTDLNALKDLLLSMGGFVEKAIESLDHGVREQQSDMFKVVEANEKLINNLHLEIDEACLLVLAKQAPVAIDLRLVIAVAKINTDLERMGDQVRNISYGAAEFIRSGETMPSQWDQMVEEVKWMVKAALDAFVGMNEALSRQVLRHDDVVDEHRNQLIEIFKERMKANSSMIDVGVEAISMFKNMERIADHATNIAEEVIFVVTGNDIRHGRTIGG